MHFLYRFFDQSSLFRFCLHFARAAARRPDQIAWFTEEKDGSKPLLSLRYTDRAGMFDLSQTALASSKLTAQQKSFRVSDHYPLWAEFAVS